MLRPFKIILRWKAGVTLAVGGALTVCGGVGILVNWDKGLTFTLLLLGLMSDLCAVGMWRDEYQYEAFRSNAVSLQNELLDAAKPHLDALEENPERYNREGLDGFSVWNL